MRWFLCNNCGKGYNVVGEVDEVSRLLANWESGFPCITPLCRGRLQSTVPHSHHGLCLCFESIPVKEFYRAFKGFGLSSSAPASIKRATELLVGKRVVAVEGESIGTPERTLIYCLILEDGTRLHFDASSKGACLYYIEEPGDALPSDTGTEVAGKGGKEAGRSPSISGEVVEG